MPGTVVAKGFSFVPKLGCPCIGLLSGEDNLTALEVELMHFILIVRVFNVKNPVHPHGASSKEKPFWPFIPSFREPGTVKGLGTPH
jgi:hypothetical protein